MSQLSISYQHPKYVSDIFAGSVIIDCTFPTEGFHLVTVESSKDQENWSVFQSQVVDLNLSFKVLSPSKSLFFRLTMSKQPTAINMTRLLMTPPLRRILRMSSKRSVLTWHSLARQRTLR